MSDQSKKYKISIMGENYSIVTDEAQEHIAYAASLVDTHMKEMAHKLGPTDIKKIAILSALQTTSKLIYAQEMLAQEYKRHQELASLIDSISLNDLPDSQP